MSVYPVFLEALARLGQHAAIAEGDTGGLLLARLTELPGSSAVVLGGVVAYGDDLKRDVLGVPAGVILEYGSVSAECAEAMARGVRALARAEIGVATTGIAGPGGARPGKPVGLSFVAVAHGERVASRRFEWQGDRAGNRAQSAVAALQLALEMLTDAPA